MDSADLARGLLRNLYVERKDNHWRSVANCLDAIIRGEVTDISNVIRVAMRKSEEDCPHRLKIIKRAQKISNRPAPAGRREAEELAKAAVTIAIERFERLDFSTHLARMGFNRSDTPEFSGLVDQSLINVSQVIQNLNSGEAPPIRPPDSSDPQHVIDWVITQNANLQEQLHLRDELLGMALACSVNEGSPWELIDSIADGNNRLLPNKHEMKILIFVFASYAEDGLLNFDALPPLPKEMTFDPVNFPLLSAISAGQSDRSLPRGLSNTRISLEDFCRQILLEALFISNGADND